MREVMPGKPIGMLVPCAGALVTCGEDPETGYSRVFRVSAYMRPARSFENFSPVVVEAQASAFGEIEYSDSEKMLEMEFCPRTEATHLALTGRVGLVAPITSCKVVGRAPWTPEQLQIAQDKADSLGERRQVV